MKGLGGMDSRLLQDHRKLIYDLRRGKLEPNEFEDRMAAVQAQAQDIVLSP